MGITDGSVVCNLCGEPLTRCGLCEGVGVVLIPNPDILVAERERKPRQNCGVRNNPFDALL